jgi:Bacterial PH domain
MTWQTTAEDFVLTLLRDGEEVLRSATGAIGMKGAFTALTNRRVLMIRQGTWRWSPLQFNDIRLQDIASVHCERGMLTAPHTLMIHARSGVYGIQFAFGQARREAAMWPNWILEAQDAVFSRS